MIIKATKVKSIRHADILAKHLLRMDENELVEVMQIRGTARPDDLAASLRSMQRATELTQGKTGLFHVAINPREHEADEMTPEQWEHTLKAIEKEFELVGQPCALTKHTKNGRSHIHAVYQLTNTEKGKLIDIKHDHYRCVNLGLKLEKELSHELTSRERSRKSYTRKEQQQAKRLGEKVTERRADLRNIYEHYPELRAFQRELTAKGYSLAQGDRAAVVLVNEQGEVFSLSRELGIKAGDVKAYLGQQIEILPTIEQAQKSHREKVADIAKKKEIANDNRHAPYQQTVKVNFNTRDFETAIETRRQQLQEQHDKAEQEKQQRIAEQLRKWNEQKQKEQGKKRDKGLDLSL